MYNLEWIFSMRPTTDSENRDRIKENRIQRQKETTKPKKKTKIWITSGLLAFYAISTYVRMHNVHMWWNASLPVCPFASKYKTYNRNINYTSHRQMPKENLVFVAFR